MDGSDSVPPGGDLGAGPRRSGRWHAVGAPAAPAPAPVEPPAVRPAPAPSPPAPKVEPPAPEPEPPASPAEATEPPPPETAPAAPAPEPVQPPAEAAAPPPPPPPEPVPPPPAPPSPAPAAVFPPLPPGLEPRPAAVVPAPAAEEEARADEAAPAGTPKPRHRGRRLFAYVVAALVVLALVGGLGYALGHRAVSTEQARTAAAERRARALVVAGHRQTNTIARLRGQQRGLTAVIAAQSRQIAALKAQPGTKTTRPTSTTQSTTPTQTTQPTTQPESQRSGGLSITTDSTRSATGLIRLASTSSRASTRTPAARAVGGRSSRPLTRTAVCPTS